MKKMHKIAGILIIIIIVTLFINSTLNQYIEEELDILTIIGEETSTSQLSLNEYILLSEKTVGIYLKWVQEGRYADAYKLLTSEYRQYVLLEEYESNMKKIDFTSYDVKNIVQKTENMYIAYVETKDGMNHEILIIMEKEKFTIVPEPFLKYVTVGNDITKDNVKYELIGYEINVNGCIFDVKITNNNKEEIKITSAKMVTEDNISVEAENGEYTIESNSRMNISFVVNKTLEIPILFEIERDAGKTIRTYNFKLK